MVLIDLRDYLTSRKRASIADLAGHFSIEIPAMEGLLATWMAKGRIRRLKDHLPCGTCGKCEPSITDIYEWVGINGCADPHHAHLVRQSKN